MWGAGEIKQFTVHLCSVTAHLVIHRNMLMSSSVQDLRSQVVSSKQPKLGLTQELSFSRISESTTRYTFTPCVGSFTLPGIDTRLKKSPAFSVSSERHRQMWGE